MVRILRKAGCLGNGCKVEMFLFHRYPIDSMENLSLMFTLKFIYNSKFKEQPFNEKTFLLAYKNLITLIIRMSIPISLWALNIDKILSEELG